jgi:hypothetical protein
MAGDLSLPTLRSLQYNRLLYWQHVSQDRFVNWTYSKNEYINHAVQSNALKAGLITDIMGRRTTGMGNDVNFSHRHHVQTCSGTHSISYPMTTGRSLSLEVKRPGREVDHSLPYSAEVKNARSYTSIHPYVFTFFMAWYLGTETPP